MLKNERGSAMVFSIIALVVIFAFTTVFIFLGGNNRQHAIKEEQKTQAYYVAKTGAEAVLRHAETSGDIIGELNKYVTEGESEGSFDKEKFEIKVIKKDDPDELMSIYHIKSTAEVNETKDSTTAVVKIDEGIPFPQFNGTIFSSGDGKMDIEDLDKLTGDNVTLNTPHFAEEYPIRILKPAELINILKDLKTIPKNEKGIEFLDKETDYNYRVKIEENFGNGKIKKIRIYRSKDDEEEKLKAELHYGFNMEVEFEDDIKKVNEQLDKYFKTDYENSKFVPNKKEITDNNINYEVIEHLKKNHWTIDATTNSSTEPLEIRAEKLDLMGNVTIKTSENRDIIIITNDFELTNRIEVEGKGQLTILVGKSIEFNNGEMIMPNKADVDIYLKEDSNLGFQNKTSIDGARIFAIGSNVNLQEGVKFKGQIINERLDINSKMDITSFTEDELNDKNTKKPKLYIEWKK